MKEEKNKDVYLQLLWTPFPTKINITPQPLGAVLEQNKKEIRKNGYLQPLVTSFSTKISITPQLLGAAFRKSTGAFCGYIRGK